MRRLEKTIYWALFVVLAMFSTKHLPAQPVPFGLYADGESLDIQFAGSVEVLDFGSITNTGETITVRISLTEEDVGEVVPLVITGIRYLDVTVDFPPTIQLVQQGIEDGDEMTLSVGLAYSNRGLDLSEARQSPTEVPLGMSSITFPIQRRTGGPPGPPPTPPHAGYTPPMGTAYIFVYGDLEVGDVSAGLYTGQIDIHVYYSDYGIGN